MYTRQRYQGLIQWSLKIICQANRATIKDEIKVLEGLCDNNIRDGSAQEAYENITPSIFQEFSQAVLERCPLIHEAIETLVV